MKPKYSVVLSAVLGLFAAGTGHAAVVLSNLLQPTTGFDYVNGPGSAEVMHAALFTTGSSAGGYSLDSVSLSIRFSTPESVANGNFRVDIYSSSGGQPSAPIRSLTGSADPATTGTYTYTTSGLTLAASTPYWVVAQVTSGDSTYLWNYSQNNTLDQASAGWTLDGTYADYRPGDGWVVDSGTPSLLSISASPVPEPAEYALLSGLGLVGAAYLRRRRTDR